MLELMIKGIFIGIVFGIPLGAVGILTIHRTLSRGVYAGLISGLGSSFADVFYVTISVFSITILSDFFITYQKPIGLIGGLLIIVIGIQIINAKEKNISKQDEKSYLSYCLSSFFMTLANPISLFSFMAIFSSIGIGIHEDFISKLGLCIGVFIGTGSWWIVISMMTYYLGERVKDILFEKLNIVFGVLLIILGIVFLMKLI